jgi:hypothetical protein
MLDDVDETSVGEAEDQAVESKRDGGTSVGTKVALAALRSEEWAAWELRNSLYGLHYKGPVSQPHDQSNQGAYHFDYKKR